MAGPARASTEPLHGVWGVLRTGPPSPTLPPAQARALAVVLEGLVAVGGDFPDAATSSVPLPAHATDAQCLAAAIRQLPQATTMLAWFGDGMAVSDWPAAVAELSAELGDADAALLAVAVTDAVKQVYDGRIRRAVAREGLCVPVPALLVRTSPARARLLRHLDGAEDPIAALSTSGLTVHVVPLRAPIGW